jgi:hypothetical protein
MPGLDDRKPVHRGIEPRERQRHAEVVVEIALGRQHAAGRAAEQQRQQVLGRGLARTAGDAHHRAA